MTRHQLSRSLHLVTIFLEVRVLPREAWDEHIARCCGDNTGLAEEVRALLEDDLRMGDLRVDPGTLIAGRYRLETELGGGASGTVWRSLDTKISERRVAIKLLHPLGEGDRGLLRAHHEASAASQVVSDHVARIEDVGICEQTGAYLVMELCAESVDGVLTNARSMSATPPRTLREAVRWSIQVARGVQALHEQGVFHRDLKPDNVLIRPHSRRAQVVDFGLARRRSEARAGPRPQPPQEGHATTHRASDLAPRDESPYYPGPQGTLCFMAPEQASGLRRDLDPEVPGDYAILARIDVYGIGAILYHLLAGHPPFIDVAEDMRPDTLLRLMRTRAPTPLAQAGRTEPRFRVPPRLSRIVETAMDRDPRRRYASCAELASDLDRYLECRTTSLDQTPSLGSAWLWVLRHRQFLAPLAPIAALAVLVGSQRATDLELDSAQASLASARDRAGRVAAELASDRAQKAAHAADHQTTTESRRAAAAQWALGVERRRAQDAQRRADRAARALRAARAQHVAATAETPAAGPSETPAESTATGSPAGTGPGAPAPRTSTTTAPRPPPPPPAHPSDDRGRAAPADLPDVTPAAPPRNSEKDRFVRSVQRNPATAWEIRKQTPQGRVTGLCLPVSDSNAVRCRALAQFSPPDRRLLRDALDRRPRTARRILIRDQAGRIAKKCVDNLPVTGSHVRKAACQDL